MPRKMAESGRVELAGSDKGLTPGSKIGPAVSKNETISVLVRLRRGRPLPRTGGRSFEHLSRDKYTREHGAKPADIKKVSAFAKRYNLEVDGVLGQGRSIMLKGTVGDFSRAFEVELRTHQMADGSTYRGA